MSGYIAMVRKDGPVDVGLLERMTKFMAFRGPDARNIWSQGPAGLGHAQLRTTWEDATDRQPLSQDGKRWLVADARIDGRRDLIAGLRTRGRIVEESCPDSHLILAAHAVWGEQCVDHLLGDFAFVIWDAETQTLFGARDQFGLKLLYYAEVAGVLLVSNTVNALRLHPGISTEIDEYALADRFLFQQNLHHERTLFRQIRQLPPAHTLVWRAGKLGTRRYWELPIEEPLSCRREEEYEEQFLAVFGEAVKDRLRSDRVAFTMSGGMDSTTVAAVAKQADTAARMDLKAFCVVYDRVIVDRERHFAALAAKGVGLPVAFFSADDYPPLASSTRLVSPRAAPPGVFDSLTREFDAGVAGFSRVVLTGKGADPVLYVTKILDVRPLSRLGGYLPAIVRLLSQGQRPPWGLKSRLQALVGRKEAGHVSVPSFLRQEFVTRTDLTNRGRDFESRFAGLHPTRPMAYECLLHPAWSGGLGVDFDAESSGFPLEYRHPFLDVRVVRFLLRVPPWPFFIHKKLIRNAMRGKLPDVIVNRPKTPLLGWKVANFYPAHLDLVERALPGLRSLEPWADVSQISKIMERDLLDMNRLTTLDNGTVEDSLALLSLSGWLTHTQKTI